MKNLTNGHFFEFASFRVDAEQKCLLHHGKVVPLTSKAFETLLVLIENNGRIVEKEELLNQVWANTFVEESTLSQNISTLRKAFAACEVGNQFIETIPRRGYRFSHEVHQFENEDDLYVVETRQSTRILAERTEIHETDPVRSILATHKYLQSHKLSSLGISFVLVAVLVGTFVIGRQALSNGRERFSQIETSTLVSSGDIIKMALSPDGKYVALIEYKGDLQRLLVKQPNSSNAVELIPPSGDKFIGVAFSPDAESIYYSIYPSSEGSNPEGKAGRLYKIPVLGGPQIEIVNDIDSPVAISTDGKHFAFIRRVPSEETAQLIVLEQNESGIRERILASRPFTEAFSNDGLSWSPDGKNLAAVAHNENASMDLVIVETENGEQRKLNQESWEWVGQTAWLQGGESLLFTAYREGSSNFTDEIWITNIAEGKARLVTDGIKGVAGISMSSDSKSVAVVRANRLTSLWVGSLDGHGSAAIINKSIGDFSQSAHGINWTPDGRIVYDSAADGNSDIWIANSDGSDTKKITGDRGADFMPVVTNDGRYIVFVSNRTGDLNLWRMELDGTKATQLTTLQNISGATISPDNKWVFFSGSESKAGRNFAWRVPLDGGKAEKLTDRICLSPKISPDGKYIAGYYPQEVEPGKFSPPLKPTILAADGSRIIKQFNNLPLGFSIPISWTADGTGFTYALRTNGVSNIWFQNAEGGDPRQLTDFKTDEIFRYEFSPDGKRLAFEKGFRVNDVLVIRDKVHGN